MSICFIIYLCLFTDFGNVFRKLEDTCCPRALYTVVSLVKVVL